MPRLKPKYQIELTPEQVSVLTKTSQNYTAPYCEVQRAKILLLAHARYANAEIARLEAIVAHARASRALRKEGRA